MQSRIWINVLFWLVWAGGVISLFTAWPDRIESRGSLLLAAAALWVNFYPRFVQGARLVCTANQVTILGIPLGNQLPVLIDIALSDFLSSRPSPAARHLMANADGLRVAVEQGSRDYLSAWFQQNPPGQGFYVPPDDLIRKFLQDSRTTPTFFIPLFIYNAGARHGEIGSVLMTAELTSDRSRKWAYAAYFEMDESKLIQVDQRMRDLDKLSAFFPGHTISPNGSTKLNLYFIPHHEVLGVTLSTTSLAPGIYDLRIIGLDPRGRRVFSTRVADYPVTEENLLHSFKNAQWTFHAHIDESILKAMRARR